MSNNKLIKGDQIDLAVLITTLWNKKMYLVKVISFSTLLGIFVSLTLKVEYQSQCKLMPEGLEDLDKNLGSLGGLAGLAGINLDLGGSGFLTPDLYPEIVKSTPFLIELYNAPILFLEIDTIVSSNVYFETIDRRTIYTYLLDYSIGLPFRIFRKNQSSALDDAITKEFIYLSEDDWELLEKFGSRISVSVDSKNGVILVSTEMPDPFASAKLADLVVKKLTEEVTAYKIEKAEINLNFISNQFNEAKIEYEDKQTEVADFADKNKNLSSFLAQAEYKRLENQMNIAFEVYKGLASQLEQAKIRVKEETPVFTILDPPRIPEDKSKPKRSIIVLIFMIIGFIGASMKILIL